MPEETVGTDQSAESSISSQTSETKTNIATQVEASQAVSESYVNADGTLKEGWKDHLIPEDFRGRPVYNAVGNDVAGLLKHIGNQDIAISRQGKGVFVPGENATETEKEMFYNAIGRPETPEGYEFAVPDEQKEYYDDSLLKLARETLYNVGLNKEQFTAVMALDAKRTELAQQEMNENPLEFYEDLMPLVNPILKQKAEDSLKTKWGDAYKMRLHYANMAITEATEEGEEREGLLERYGNDPVFADFAATMYLKHHTESNGVDTSLGHGTQSMNIEQRIKQINSELTPDLKLTNRTRYETLLIEKNKLYNQKYPEK